VAVTIPLPAAFPHLGLDALHGFVSDDGEPLLTMAGAVNWLIAHHRPPAVAACPHPESASGVSKTWVLPLVPSVDALEYEVWVGWRTTAGATLTLTTTSSAGSQPGGSWDAVAAGDRVLGAASYELARVAVGTIQDDATHLRFVASSAGDYQVDMLLVIPRPYVDDETLHVGFTGASAYKATAWDLTVTAAQGIALTGVRFRAALTGSRTMRFYVRAGTAVGFTSSSSGWTLLHEETITTTAGAIYEMTLTAAVPLAAGVHGCYLTPTLDSSPIRYQSGSPTIYSDAWAQLTTYSVNAINFGTTFAGYRGDVGVTYEVSNVTAGSPASGAIPVAVADLASEGPIHRELLNRMHRTARAVLRDRRQCVFGWCQSTDLPFSPRSTSTKPWLTFAVAQAALRGQAGATVTARVGAYIDGAAGKIQVGERSGPGVVLDITSTTDFDYEAATFQIAREMPVFYATLYSGTLDMYPLYVTIDWRPGD